MRMNSGTKKGRMCKREGKKLKMNKKQRKRMIENEKKSKNEKVRWYKQQRVSKEKA